MPLCMLGSFWLCDNCLHSFFKLELDDLAKVQEVLWGARTAWKNIGIHVGLHKTDLTVIDKQNGEIDEKFTEILALRLRRAEPLTWKMLQDALNHKTVDMENVALEFEIRDIK